MPIFKELTQFERGVKLNGTSYGTFIAKNWHPGSDSSYGVASLFQSAMKQWYSFGVLGLDTLFGCSVDGVDWLSLGTITNFEVSCALGNYHIYAANGLMIGGGLSTGTNAKIRRSFDGGANWESITIGSVDTSVISAMAASTAGYLAINGTDIYHSLSGNSGTYTVAQVMANAGVGLCTNGSNMHIAYSSVGSTFYTSTNGTSWTTRTFPNGFVATAMAYGIVDGAEGYLAVGADSTGPAVYSAVSGAVWGLRYRFLSDYTLRAIASMDDTFIARTSSTVFSISVWYSNNGGLNWNPATTFAGPSNSQVIAAKRLGDRVHHQVGILAQGKVKMSIVG